ncbi:MAG: hypothetical protein Q8O52_23340 [Sulfuritalea sp.]|nr:hypothetical protein [Sulfuritalea sp.]
MATPCGGDPLVCMDFVALFIGEFLKDWTTLAMLAILLVLLLMLRADRRKAAEAAYARQLEAYDNKRHEETGQAPTWVVGNDKTDER